MNTIVLKFGGSSIADNIRLNIVANKIIEFKNNGNKIIVVVSAQGKTTDNLIKESKELAYMPNLRELDQLLSTGENVSMSKLAILLNQLGYKAISLTGWQAGINTTGNYQSSIIENINTSRIKKELDNDNIVIVAGFQGINENADITTLGRGGSDTTAVAIATSINAKRCYIFSDVDGVYSSDPNKIKIAKKLETLSYKEMLEISNEGAKVLHNRCVEIGERFKLPIITGSTFNNNPGTIIEEKIEETSVKSIVKNDNIMLINFKYETYSSNLFNKIYNTLLVNNILPSNIINNSIYSLDLDLILKSDDFSKFQLILENEFKKYNIKFSNISTISIIGYGIINDNTIIKKLLDIINSNNLEIYNISSNQIKIKIIFKDKISDKVLEQFHVSLI